MARVFISYRHAEPDQTVALYLYRYLLEQGHDPFLDAREIQPGDFWDREIRANIERAPYFIALVSSQYLYSPFIVQEELGRAGRLLKEGRIERILQVNLAYDGDPPEEIRDIVTRIQFLKWRSPADTARIAEQIVRLLPAEEIIARGLRPFGLVDAKLFEQLGREDEIARFAALLQEGATPYILLHGVSGAGKSSFLRAGVLARLAADPLLCDMDEETVRALASPGSPAARNAGAAPLLLLDQFERALLLFAQDPALARAFAAALRNGSTPGRTVVFCIRDEYRTAFEAMLPEVAARCEHVPLLPLAPEVAARVLALLLENARVPHDPAFLLPLCRELASGVPQTVLPAILQLITQYCRNHDLRLDRPSWQEVTLDRGSLFEDHVQDAVLSQAGPRASRLAAARTLAALSAGTVRSPPRTVEEIGEDHGLPHAVVQRTLALAALPHARVVVAEMDDSPSAATRYRLSHDLFAPAVRVLADRTAAESERRVRRNVIRGLSSLLGLVLAALGAVAVLNREIRTERDRAQALMVANQAEQRRNEGPWRWEESFELGVSSLRSRLTAEGERVVRRALLEGTSLVLSVTAAPAGPPDSLEITPVALSGDGSRAAVSAASSFYPGEPAWLVVHRTSDGAQLGDTLKLPGHFHLANAQLSPDGSLLAAEVWSGRVGSAAPVRRLSVWRVPIRVNTPPIVLDSMASPSHWSYAWSPGGLRLAASGGTGSRLWDLSGPAPALLALGPPAAQVVGFSADGRRIALRQNARYSIWEWQGSRVIPALTVASPMSAPPAALSPSGRLLVVAGEERMIVWDVEQEAEFQVVTETMRRVLFHPDRDRLVTVSGPDAAVWDLERQERGEVLTIRASLLLPSDGGVRDMAFSADGRLLATAGEDRIVRVWRPDDGRQLAIASNGAEVPRMMRFAGAGSGLVTLTGPEARTRSVTIRRWELHPHTYVPLADHLVPPLRGYPALAPMGRYAATVHEGTFPLLGLWDGGTGRLAARAPEEYAGWLDPSPRPLAVSADGRLVATNWMERTGMVVWNAGGRVLRPVPAPALPRGRVLAAAFGGAAAEYLAVVEERAGTGSVTLWRGPGGPRLQPLTGAAHDVALPISGTFPLVPLAFSPDGQLLATGIARRGGAFLRLTATATGDTTLLPHPAPVTAAAFSPDGRYLVTGTLDGRVLGWRIGRRPRRADTLGSHGHPVAEVAVGAGGRVVTLGMDGYARGWSRRYRNGDARVRGLFEILVEGYRTSFEPGEGRAIAFDSTGTKLLILDSTYGTTTYIGAWPFPDSDQLLPLAEGRLPRRASRRRRQHPSARAGSDRPRARHARGTRKKTPGGGETGHPPGTGQPPREQGAWGRWSSGGPRVPLIGRLA